jgi:HK97 gp10 family phage protein
VIFVDTSDLQRWGGLLASEVKSVGVRLERAVGEQQMEVVVRATAAAPVLSGTMRGTIRPLGGGLRRRVRAGSSKAFYARYQEFGTRKMAANPFLFPQADAAAHAEFERRANRALDEGEIYQ